MMTPATMVSATTPTEESSSPHWNSIHSIQSPLDDTCWVLVYGYTTEYQAQELLDMFHTIGHVIQVNHRHDDHQSHYQQQQQQQQPQQHQKHDGFHATQYGNSIRNWMAIQYQSPLEAEKALCHSPIILSNHVICGVVRLTPELRQLLQHQPFSWKNQDADLRGGDDDVLLSNNRFTTNGRSSSNGHHHHHHHHHHTQRRNWQDEDEEEDILLHANDIYPSSWSTTVQEDNPSKTNRATNKHTNICEQFLAWWFGWNNLHPNTYHYD